jgi:hypothetical protein
VSSEDEWNLDALRVSQEFAEGLGVEPVVADCPVRKPDKAAWIRTHPDPSYSIETLILELREERESYLVSPRLHSALIAEPTVTRQLLTTAITRQGRLFLWPLKLPGPDGRSNPWNDAAAEGARRARTKWVRIASDMAYGSYRIWEASADLGEPKWPKLAFSEILKLAFADRFIRDLDHPVVRRLRDGS